VTVTDEALSADLVDGRTFIVPLVWFPRLWHGSKEERKNLEIFGDGAHIHRPDLDEDLTVAGLLAGKRSGESPTSLKKWLASRKSTSRKPKRQRSGQGCEFLWRRTPDVLGGKFRVAWREVAAENESMTIKGRVQNGMIVLEGGMTLPEGTPVTVSYDVDGATGGQEADRIPAGSFGTS